MSKSIILNPEVLKKLYLDEKLDSYKVAHILNCSPSHVRDSLRENSIKSRSVQEAKALTPPRYKRTDFSGNSVEKAYLIGFRLGDLHISKTHPNSPTIRIGTNTTRTEQMALFKKLFSKYGFVKIHNKDSQGARSCRAYVNNTFSFLLENTKNVPDWIRQKNTRILGFLAGYTDAEGTFCICAGRSPVFSIKSQDKEILFEIYNMLAKMNISVIRPYLVRNAGSINNGIVSNKDVYGMFVYKRETLRLLIKKLLPFLKHSKRRNDALKVLNYVRA